MGSPAFEGGFRRRLGNSAPNLHFVGTQLAGDTFGDNGDGGYHEGYSGGVVVNKETAILASITANAPDVVLIWFGTGEVQSDIEDVSVLYDFAADCLAKPSVSAVIVGTCAPRKTTDVKYAQQNTYRSAVNTHFQTTMAPLPAGMYHCDPGGVIASDDDFTDGVHLAPAGYALVAPVWRTALAAAGIQLTQPDAGTDCGDVV